MKFAIAAKIDIDEFFKQFDDQAETPDEPVKDTVEVPTEEIAYDPFVEYDSSVDEEEAEAKPPPPPEVFPVANTPRAKAYVAPDDKDEIYEEKAKEETENEEHINQLRDNIATNSRNVNDLLESAGINNKIFPVIFNNITGLESLYNSVRKFFKEKPNLAFNSAANYLSRVGSITSDGISALSEKQKEEILPILRNIAKLFEPMTEDMKIMYDSLLDTGLPDVLQEKMSHLQLKSDELIERLKSGKEKVNLDTLLKSLMYLREVKDAVNSEIEKLPEYAIDDINLKATNAMSDINKVAPRFFKILTMLKKSGKTLPPKVIAQLTKEFLGAGAKPIQKMRSWRSQLLPKDVIDNHERELIAKTMGLTLEQANLIADQSEEEANVLISDFGSLGLDMKTPLEDMEGYIFEDIAEEYTQSIALLKGTELLKSLPDDKKKKTHDLMLEITAAGKIVIDNDQLHSATLITEFGKDLSDVFSYFQDPEDLEAFKNNLAYYFTTVQLQSIDPAEEDKRKAHIEEGENKPKKSNWSPKDEFDFKKIRERRQRWLGRFPGQEGTTQEGGPENWEATAETSSRVSKIQQDYIKRAIELSPVYSQFYRALSMAYSRMRLFSPGQPNSSAKIVSDNRKKIENLLTKFEELDDKILGLGLSLKPEHAELNDYIIESATPAELKQAEYRASVLRAKMDSYIRNANKNTKIVAPRKLRTVNFNNPESSLETEKIGLALEENEPNPNLKLIKKFKQNIKTLEAFIREKGISIPTEGEALNLNPVTKKDLLEFPINGISQLSFAQQVNILKELINWKLYKNNSFFNNTDKINLILKNLDDLLETLSDEERNHLHLLLNKVQALISDAPEAKDGSRFAEEMKTKLEHLQQPVINTQDKTSSLTNLSKRARQRIRQFKLLSLMAG